MQGLRLAWVGVNQETLFDALAVQLKDVGIQRSVGRTSTTGSITYDDSGAQVKSSHEYHAHLDHGGWKDTGDLPESCQADQDRRDSPHRLAP